MNGAGDKPFFFDGGCRPNPGRIEAAVARGGQVWFDDALGEGDNNEAEWLALLMAVRLMSRDDLDRDPPREPESGE